MNHGLTILSSTFESHKNKIAVEDANEAWTYEELLNKASSLSTYFQKELKPNSKVLIIPGKRIEFIASVLACSLGGFQPIFVSEKATADELEFIKNKTKPDLVWDKGLDSIDNKVEKVFSFSNVPLLFFTSGTTGNPKGICHEFNNVLLNAKAFNMASGLSAEVRMLHTMPIGYMAGLLNTFLCPLLIGGSVIVADAFSAMSAMGLWSFILEKNVNSLWLSPTMVATLTKLCRSEEISKWTKENLKYVFVGTAPLHEATRISFKEKTGVDCIQSYGMTECMFISVCSNDDLELKNSVGKPLAGVEVESRGDEGHIFVKSEFLLKGFLGNKNNLEEVKTDNGWLDSGDIGVLDSRKRITITGRHKDLIIKGGLNISPKSIEEVLLSIAEVQEVAVVGVEHEFWGEDILACVKLEEGSNTEVNELKLYCREKLSKDAVPGKIVIVKEFPRNSSGKIQKSDLKAL